MEIIIRKADKSDIPQLIELIREFSVFEKKPEKMSNSIGKMRDEFDFFNCFVAVDEKNSIVAYLSYFYSYYTWSGKSLYMDDLYVAPNYRGRKIGIDLLNKLIDLGKSTGCHKLRWQVAKWNKTAINFYKSIGAEIEDVELDCDLIFD